MKHREKVDENSVHLAQLKIFVFFVFFLVQLVLHNPGLPGSVGGSQERAPVMLVLRW